jgi:nucleoid-associated protein YgaU
MANERRIGGTIAILGATAVAVVGVLFGALYWSRSEKQAADNTPPAQASAQPPQVAPPNASPAGAAPADPAAKPAATAPAPETAAAPADAPLAPSFDVVRVEPDGESVIAGRSAPGATIELLRGDQVHARGVADASGLFAIIPPPLPPGSHQIVLQSIAPDGARQRSRESVTVMINPDKSRPLVALASPDKPTVLLSNPEMPEAKPAPEPKVETKTAEAKPAAPGAVDPKTAESKASEPKASEPLRPAQQAEVPAQPAPQQQASAAPATPPAQAPQTSQRPQIKIVSVDAEEGKLFVSGLSAPGATIRLYLNESLIAPGGAGGDGKVSFAIGSGVRPGDYRVRLDDVDPVSGQVKSRAEVIFNVPVQVASATPQTPPARQAAPAASLQSAPAAPDSPAAGARTGPTDAQVAAAGTIVIPSISTAFVARGDNLWRISQRIYGKGYRYTEIYGANQQQIRNPHLIYPGQVFVLPGEQEHSNQSQAD